MNEYLRVRKIDRELVERVMASAGYDEPGEVDAFAAPGREGDDGEWEELGYLTSRVIADYDARMGTDGQGTPRLSGLSFSFDGLPGHELGDLVFFQATSDGHTRLSQAVQDGELLPRWPRPEEISGADHLIATLAAIAANVRQLRERTRKAGLLGSWELPGETDIHAWRELSPTPKVVGVVEFVEPVDTTDEWAEGTLRCSECGVEGAIDEMDRDVRRNETVYIGRGAVSVSQGEKNYATVGWHCEHCGSWLSMPDTASITWD